MHQPATTCCFSGHRPEKFPGYHAADVALPAVLADKLAHTVRRAAEQGYTHFITGMSRGFDLWAAQTVLTLSETLPLSLVCAIPFDGQEAKWPLGWRTVYDQVLRRAGQVYLLSSAYSARCFHARNRFLVEHSSRLICYFDGQHGGTAYTVRYAAHSGIEVVNLADAQLRLELPG